MNADDSKRIVMKALELSYAEWERTGEPVKPGTKEAEILLVEAAASVLKDLCEEKKREIQ